MRITNSNYDAYNLTLHKARFLLQFNALETLVSSNFDDGTLQSWFSHAGSLDTFEVSIEESFSGSYSVKIQDDQAAFTKAAAHTVSYAQGNIYSAEAMVYIASGDITDAQLYLGPIITGNIPVTVFATQTGAWHKLIIPPTLGEISTGSILVRVGVKDDAIVYFDDVRVFKHEISNEYATGEFSGRDFETQKLYFDFPEMSATEIIPLQPNFNLLGNFRALLLDKDREITELIKNYPVFGRQVTVKSLFEELTINDAIDLFSGVIVDYERTKFEGYQLLIESAYPYLDVELFNGLSEAELTDQFSPYFANTTTTNAPSSGSDVWVELTNNMEGWERDDLVYLEHASTPSTKEITAIKETRVNTTNQNLDIKLDLANTYVSGSIVNSKHLNTDNNSVFPLSVPANPPFIEGLHILVGREIMKYSTRDAQGLLITSRNLYGSTRERHTAGAKVKEVWVIRDNPIDLMLNFMTTTSAGTNGDYDLGIANFGAGMDAALIDFAAAENIRQTYFASVDYRFIIDGPRNCADLVVEIMKSLGIYPVATGSGILSFRKVQNVTPAMSVMTLTDADIHLPDSDTDERELPIRWNPSLDQLVNEVELKLDWVPGRNEYLTTLVYELAASKTTYGMVKRVTIESKGMRSDLGTINIGGYLSVLAKKYGNPPPRIESELKWPAHVLESGDVVLLTSSLFPNLKTGEYDLLDEVMELVKCEPVPGENKVRIAGYLYDQISHVDVGSLKTVVPSDRTAQFNSTDSADVAVTDATYDNSADQNVSATKITVQVRIILLQDNATGNQSVDYHIRIGSNVHLATMTVEDDLDYTHVWIASKYEEGYAFVNTHIFEFGSSAVRDVKLDYYARSGSDAEQIDSISILGITYENDGEVYTQI